MWQGLGMKDTRENLPATLLRGQDKRYYKEKGCVGEMGEKEKQNGVYSVKEGAGDAGVVRTSLM